MGLTVDIFTSRMKKDRTKNATHFRVFWWICEIFWKWTLNFLKGHKPSLNTKMKISKKVCTVSGNGKNVFCSSHHNLFGGKLLVNTWDFFFNCRWGGRRDTQISMVWILVSRHSMNTIESALESWKYIFSKSEKIFCDFDPFL